MEEANYYSKRWLILFLVIMSVFMSSLDGSIVNVALPTIARALNVSMSNVTLVTTSYLIVISATVLIFGRIGDMYGKTKVYMFGLALFSIGSLLCGLTASFNVLILARVVQALGAAGTMATSQGIITEVFPAGERGRALGFSGAAVALGGLAGPGLGGLITGNFKWELIFLINVPIGLAVLFFSIKLLPLKHPKSKEKIDGAGALLFMITIISLFAALGKMHELGISNPYIIAGLALAFISFVAFIILERRRTSPLLDLSIFKNGLFSLSILCAFISFVVIFCSNIIQPFYLQNAMGFLPFKAGLILMIYPIVMMIVAPMSGHLSDKIGSEILTFIGLCVVTTGMFLMSTLKVSSPLFAVILYTGILSLGMGLFQSPNTSLIMSTVPKDKLGIAGSTNALIRNLGMVCGTVFSTYLLYNRMSHMFGSRVTDYIEGRSDIFIYGMRRVYIAAGTISAVGGILTFIRLVKNRSSKS